MQIGQGVSRSSPFGAARRWRRGPSDDAEPPRVGTPGLGRQPADIPAAPRRGVNLTVMSGEGLERYLTGLFGRRGYTVWPVASKGEAAAGLLLCRGNQGVVVQIKRWNCPLGPEVVRSVLSAVQNHAATLARLGCSQIGGMIVATAQFTPEASQLAAASGVLLWDRQELEAQVRVDSAPRSGGGDARPARRP